MKRHATRSLVGTARAAAVIGIVVSTVTALLQKPFPAGSIQDDGLYLVLAKSVTTGAGYRFINLPGAPAATHYPPGYPAFLAGLWHMAPPFPANLSVFAIANVLLLGLAGAAAFGLARACGLAPVPSAVATIAGFLMAPALALSSALMSEPLWLALALPWLLAATIATRRPVSSGTAVWLGASAGLTALVRTQSVALAAGLVLVLAWRKEWRASALALVATALVLAPWLLWARAHGGDVPPVLLGKYGPYLPWLVDGFRVAGPEFALYTLRTNAHRIAYFTTGMFSPGLPALGGWVLLVAVGAGAARLARVAPVVLAALVVHGLVILFWPFDPTRFVWGSWPFIALAVVAGAVELWERGRPTLARVATAAVVVWLAAGVVVSSARFVVSGAYRNAPAAGARRLTPTVRWVAAHAPAGAVIASDDETAVYLYTGHLAVPILSYSAAAYEDGKGATQPSIMLDSIVALYHPAFVVPSWKRSWYAAERRASEAHPSLALVDHTASGTVFARQ